MVILGAVLKPESFMRESDDERRRRIQELEDERTFGPVLMLTKMSFVSAPGIGNLAIAIYIFNRVLPKVEYSPTLRKKFKLLAALNLIFVVMAVAVVTFICLQ